MIIEVGNIVKSIARCRVRIEYFENKIPKKKEKNAREQMATRKDKDCSSTLEVHIAADKKHPMDSPIEMSRMPERRRTVGELAL